MLAGTLSGAPSTIVALLTGRPVTESTRAAGALLGKPGIVRGASAHAAITVLWTAALARVLPARNRAAWGAAAGLGIAAVDLGVIGRHIPEIRALPLLPQLADHVAFGVIASVVLKRCPVPADIGGNGDGRAWSVSVLTG